MDRDANNNNCLTATTESAANTTKGFWFPGQIVHLETHWQTNRERNRNREAAVPEVSMEKMLSILEPPSPWEARNVEWITTG